jgi:hypothetical protein|tara:strand:- start:385 stop:591 length:207 start_codon:yes stop_codon:yes gene_type:complete
MIKGLSGKRLTPKQKAQEIIADFIQQSWSWGEWDQNGEAMTQREVDEVNRQHDLLIERLVKMGFDIKE